MHAYLFSIIAKYQNEGTLHNKRLFRKLSHTFQPKRRHFQGNKQWKMMSFREWHRHTQEKRTRCATIRSRSYDRPISTSDAPPLSCRRLVADRLTESMMTNFLHAARKGMSIVTWEKPVFIHGNLIWNLKKLIKWSKYKEEVELIEASVGCVSRPSRKITLFELSKKKTDVTRLSTYAHDSRKRFRINSLSRYF